MDGLVAAFVAALILQAGDRMPWLAAILADRRGAGGVCFGALFAVAGLYALAAIGGALLAPEMSPNARALFLAFSLIAGGSMGFGKLKPPSRFEGSKGGGFLIALIGLAALGLGDRTQFVALALAARSPEPWLAGIGAGLGSFVVIAAGALAGEDLRKSAPIAIFRGVTGALFMLIGLMMAVSALRLI